MKTKYRYCCKCKNHLPLNKFASSGSYCKACTKAYEESFAEKSEHRDFESAMLSDSDMEKELKNFKHPEVKTKLNSLSEFTKQFDKVLKNKIFGPLKNNRKLYKGPESHYMTKNYF